MSTTESLLFVAGKIFGGKKEQREVKELGSSADMLAFAAMLNGG